NYSSTLIFSSFTTSYKSVAVSFFTCSFKRSTLMVNFFCAKRISNKSPSARVADAFAGVPFTLIRPSPAICFAKGRRLIIRDTFKNLSNLIVYIIPFLLHHSKVYLIPSKSSCLMICLYLRRTLPYKKIFHKTFYLSCLMLFLVEYLHVWRYLLVQKVYYKIQIPIHFLYHYQLFLSIYTFFLLLYYLSISHYVYIPSSLSIYATTKSISPNSTSASCSKPFSNASINSCFSSENLSHSSCLFSQSKPILAVFLCIDSATSKAGES